LGFLKYISSVKEHHGQIKFRNTVSSVTVTDIKASLQSLLEKKSVRMKQSRGTYSAANITALTFGVKKLPHNTSTTMSIKLSFQKLSSSQHAYSVSVTSYYPSKATTNNSVLGYLWNTQDIISLMTSTTESE
jgi:hypothetical protein